jgi:SAM-dependent methyltransferase
MSDLGVPWASVTSTEPAGGWTGADPRYRGYRPLSDGSVRLDHRVQLAVDLVPSRLGGRVIDLGAGDGFVTGELATVAQAALAVSVDVGFPEPLSPHRRPVSRVAAFVPGPLPFRAHTFDVVVSLECIEHLLDPDALIEEALRLLKPAGCLILSTPRLDALLVVISLLGGVQPPGVEASSRRRYGNPFGEQRPSGHVHLFTRRALHEALAAHGLRIEAYKEARFSSSWWQAVRASRRPRPRDLAMRAVLAAYDLIPFKKDVMVVRAAP